jgi:hypothetical protein
MDLLCIDRDVNRWRMWTAPSLSTLYSLHSWKDVVELHYTIEWESRLLSWYSVGLRTSWMIGGLSPGSGWEFSPHHRVQNGSGAHPPIQWLSGGVSLGVKRPGCEADHSPPSSDEVKKAWRYTSTHLMCLNSVVLSLKKAQGQLYLYLCVLYH